jgi:hypothetical protein
MYLLTLCLGKYSVNLVGVPAAADRDTWVEKIVQCLSAR